MDLGEWRPNVSVLRRGMLTSLWPSAPGHVFKYGFELSRYFIL